MCSYEKVFQNITCIKSCFKLEAFKIVHGDQGLSWMVLSKGTEHTKHLVSN